MKALRSIRPLGRDSLRGIEPSTIGKWKPKFEWVDPKTLYVEEGYQRDIAENGIALIRKIVRGFSWARFKPPICVRLAESGNVLVCVDGQHTATAAASHPSIHEIPVMIISAEDLTDRAASFVGHNRDRINLTAMTMYFAEVAAHDPYAMIVARACKAAGVTVTRKPFTPSKPAKVGETGAVGTFKMLARKQDGEAFLIRVLRVMVAAQRAPIKADETAAVALLLGGMPAGDDELAAVLRSKPAHVWAAAAAIARAESGTLVTVELARLWTVALAGEEPPQERPEPAPPPKAAPRSAPALVPARAPAPPPPEPPEPPRKPFEFNGVTIDPNARTVRHRGKLSAPIPEDGLRLVAALARVMPSMLVYSDLAKRTFGRTGDQPGMEIRQLVAEIGPRLESVGLRVNEVPKMGNTLMDLGA